MTIQDATPPALGQLRRRSTPIVPAAAPRHVDVPRLWPGLVPRPRLLRRLTSAGTPIAMIVAPAGYGKTTLLAEWAMRDDRPFAWLSVEGIEGGSDGVMASLEGLVEDVGACLTPHVIVIDDAHRLAPRGSLRRITDLACRLPEGSCVAIASRRRPTAPVARLRAHRLLAEVTPRELAMTRLEAAMLLDGAGVRLDAGHVDRLVALTEGWPVALYLAALSIQEQDGAGATVEELSGGDRLVTEYIRSEVLGELSADEVAFLRRTSILGGLTAPLCDAVLDARDSAKMLVRVTRGEVPIEPADRCDSRFHCNRLLAEMLRTELAREEPELEPELHRRAADWHGRNGDVQKALQHAVACRDGARAGRLLWSMAPGCAGRGRARRLREWLEPFSATEMRAHPALALSAATFHLADGRRDEAERWAEVAEHAIDRATEPDLVVGLGMIRATAARNGIVRMGQDAARARKVAPLDGAWQGIGRLLEGIAQHLAGERAKARPLLEEGTRLARAEAPIIAALCHAQLALLAIDHDEWQDAGEHAEAARAVLAQVPETPTGHALVLAVTALTAAHDGDVFRARGDADAAVRLLGMLGGFVPWYLAEAQIVLARAHIRLSDAETARVLLARAARNHSLSADAGVLGEWLHDAWESADAFAAGATGAGPSLTNAELRVLRFLPSHLSFREIGERLHLSTNTVKTQALAVYRKLDVSCRSDAVARGRSVGLVDG